MPTAHLLTDGIYFGEGPRWHDDRLFFSDFYDHLVKTVDMNGEINDVISVPNQPSGIGWLPDGRMLVVSMLDRKVMRVEGEELVEHADLSGVATFHCNDMVVDAQGRAYVGNFGFDLDAFLEKEGVEAALGEPGPPKSVLARVDPDGSVHVAATDLRFPNGTQITPDGQTLIVGESLGQRLSAFTIAADGSLSDRRVWAELPGKAPDGSCLDADGNVWVANAIANECVLVAEGGEIVDTVETDQPCYACMLGGPERKHLFLVTAASSSAHEASASRTGHILIAEVDVPGAGWP